MYASRRIDLMIRPGQFSIFRAMRVTRPMQTIASCTLVFCATNLFAATQQSGLAHPAQQEIDSTVHSRSDIGHHAYAQPLSGLSTLQLREFAEGKKEFSARWVVPFVSGGHWGLGPQSNAESCVACHPGNGRGRAPDGPHEQTHSLVLQLALPQADNTGGALPHPAYGAQLNNRGTLGKLIEEGEFRVDYAQRTVILADGEIIELRVPKLKITSLWFGPLGDETILSPRVAQPVFGLGLLESIAESRLRAISEHQQKIGFNGRVNLVQDASTGAMAVGRFGHKATQPNLLQQTAKAFLNEMGVNSSLFPDEDCWPIQKACYSIETVLGVEAQDMQVAAIVDYLRMLAPPTRRDTDDPEVRRGEVLFERAQCSVCHIPSMELANGDRIAPYTDLLLHDMGEELADGYRTFSARARDWRTAPLWGLGLNKAVNGNNNLLHDGRARTIAEAILWHGGEAEVSRSMFVTMSRNDRKALLRFLDSL